MAEPREKPRYVHNEVMRSTIGENRFFFVPKARVLNNGIRVVVGEKIEITEFLQPFLQKKFRSDHD